MDEIGCEVNCKKKQGYQTLEKNEKQCLVLRYSYPKKKKRRKREEECKSIHKGGDLDIGPDVQD